MTESIRRSFSDLVVQVQAAHFQVLLDGEVGEDTPALRHEGDTLFHYFVGGGRQQAVAPVDLPGNYRGQSHHGFENSGFSGPIGTHYRHDLSLADPQRHVVQGRDDAIVDGYA